MNRAIVILSFLGGLTFSWLPAKTSTTLHHFTIAFKNKLGVADMQLGGTYKNPFGEDFTVNKFKYYISNIFLIDDKGKALRVTNDYFLVDMADSSSALINLYANMDKVTAIQFLLGVDSLHNVSGVQTGALDPMNGMFWTWSSGYVMAKLEGVSPVAKVPGNLFSQHVGGFKTGEKTARKIKLMVDGWQVAENDVVTIEADVNKWFQSTHNISIAENPICHSPGELAVRFADNYSTMFKIVSIK